MTQRVAKYLKFPSMAEGTNILLNFGFVLNSESNTFYFPGREIAVSVDGHKLVATGDTVLDKETGVKYPVMKPSKEWYVKMLSTELPDFGKYEIKEKDAPAIWANYQ